MRLRQRRVAAAVVAVVVGRREVVDHVVLAQRGVGNVAVNARGTQRRVHHRGP